MLNRVTLDVSAQRTAKPTLAAECYQHLLETENDTRMRHDHGKAQCEDETPQWRYAKTTRLQHCQDSLRQTTRPDALGRAPRRPPSPRRGADSVAQPRTQLSHAARAQCFGREQIPPRYRPLEIGTAFAPPPASTGASTGSPYWRPTPTSICRAALPRDHGAPEQLARRLGDDLESS